jgi:hypothetical protein
MWLLTDNPLSSVQPWQRSKSIKVALLPLFLSYIWLGLKMHRKKGAGCSFDLYINSSPKERSINSAVNVKGLQARILAIE